MYNEKKKEAWARANLEDRVLGVAQGGNDKGILLPQERTRAQHLPDLRLRCSRARLIEKTPNCCTAVPELRGKSGCANISVRDWVAARRKQKGI